MFIIVLSLAFARGSRIFRHTTSKTTTAKTTAATAVVVVRRQAVEATVDTPHVLGEEPTSSAISSPTVGRLIMPVERLFMEAVSPLLADPNADLGLLPNSAKGGRIPSS
ncbi:hypothetical protein BC629DRAFT_1538572 [Irpex lacteus]|nr:hypothetical protein BC629DRAFT_1538572 [Irpex lacteus]